MSHRLVVIICLLAAALFFGDALFGDRTLIPTGFLYERSPWGDERPDLAGDPTQQYDLLFQFYPWARYFKESVAEGRFPLWNPSNSLGTPFFANPQTALLFPTTWLHLLLPVEDSFTLIFMLKLGVLMLGMALWLRDQGLGPTACLLGALVYGLSMHTVVSLAFPYSNLSLLLPWTLLALRRVIESCNRRNMLGLIVALVLTVTAGQPQSALVSFLLLTIYALMRTGFREASWLRLLPVAACAAAAALISAVQWWPSFEFIGETMVPLGPRIIHSGLPYHPANLLNFLIPDAFGSHLRGDYWGFPGYHDTAFYSSMAALLLIPLARRKSSDAPLFVPLISLLTLGIVLGWPLFESLLDLPGFDLIRRNKFAFVAIFAMADTAARGWNSLQTDAGVGLWRSRVWWGLMPLLGFWGWWSLRPFLKALDGGGFETSCLRSLAFLLACLLVIEMQRRFPQPLWGALIVSLVLLDLGSASYALNPRGKAASLFPALQTTRDLSGTHTRIYSPHEDIYSPNASMVNGLQDVRGYDVMTPRRLFRFMQALDPQLGDALADWRRLDSNHIHASTRMQEAYSRAFERHPQLRAYLQSESYWTVTARRVESPDLFALLQVDYWISRGQSDAPSGFEPFLSRGPLRLHHNPRARRVQVYFDWRPLTPSEQPDPALIEWRQVALVEASLPAPMNPLRSSAQGEVELVEEGVQSRTYQVSLPAPAIMVEFERFSAGWSAMIDQQATSVFPVQFLFRGIWVPAGEHQVQFDYQPAGWRWGLMTSVFGLLVTALLVSPLNRRIVVGPP